MPQICSKPATLYRLAKDFVSPPDDSNRMFICGDLGRLSTRQRAFVMAKPYWRIRWFASLLNWNGLRLEWIRLSDVDAERWPDGPDSKIIVYYLTTDKHFHLQINELPDRPKLHQATIWPLRYGIGPADVAVGWHRFNLFDDDDDLFAEAQRLKPFLDRQQFRDPARRAAWKKTHPEFVL